MDIQVSSNFERLLFEMLGRDHKTVQRLMAEFAETGRFDVAQDILDTAKQLFQAWRLDDDGTLAEIARVKAATGMVLDPHSAVGVYAAHQAREQGRVDAETPIVALACAHPAKFPDAVEKATGERPALPPHLSDLMDRETQMHHISSQPQDIADFVDQMKRQ